MDNKNSTGMTEAGFNAPTYSETLEMVQDAFRSTIDKDISLSSNSVAGNLAEEIAWRITNVNQNAQGVYYAGYVSTAQGVELDRLGSNFGLTRKVATNSTAEITIRTREEYLVQAGEQFETEDGIIFNLLNDVLTVKDTTATPTKQENSDDDDEDDDEEPAPTFVGKGIVQSDEKGAMNNVPANTITVVSNPDDNIATVTNEKRAGGGQDDETDEEFRDRIIIENVAKPGATENGIRSALKNLSGVRQVNFVYNKESVTDKYGNPPYSVNIYVLGGDSQEIAQTLYDNVAAGSNLTGNQSVTIDDVNGFPTVIKFSFANEIRIFVKVKIKTNDKWNNDSDIESLKQEIADNINQLEMGKTVFSTKLYSIIYNYDGIEEAIVSVGKDENGLADNADITPDRFEVPTCVISNVEIERL